MIKCVNSKFESSMKIETKRLLIRKFEPIDFNDVKYLFSLKKEMFDLGLGSPLLDDDSVMDRLNEWIDDSNHYALILKETDTFIGYLCIDDDSNDDREDTKELGFCLLEQYRGKDYMLEALNEVLRYLKEKHIKYVWACCFKNNISSKKFIEKCGFKLMNEGVYEDDEGNCFQSYEYRIKI